MFLGVDLGTSGVKVLAVDEAGTVLGRTQASYPLDTPHPGWVEQDPDAWWRGCTDAIARLVRDLGRDDVRAIGLSGQMHTLVLTDAAGRPVRPAIGWADTRSADEVARWEERLDAATRTGVLGNPIVTGFTGPSLAWVKRHEPDAYASARRLLLAKDYLRARLTGAWGTDPSDASATLLFDPHRRDWAHGVLDALELEPSLLPRLLASDEVAGELAPTAAEACGLRPGLPVVTGAGDQAAAAIGCDLTEPGDLLVTLGSGGQVFVPLVAPAADPHGRVHLFCHARADRWHLLGAVQNVGVALDWVRTNLGWDWDTFYARATDAPAGAEGVTFVPHLTGERTPHMDPAARAAWSGLRLSHGPQHLARAALEGALFAVAEAIEACRRTGARDDAVVVTGGNARSPLARQILADVTGRALERAEIEDASARGAATLAGAPAAGLRRLPAEAPGPDAAAHCEAFARARRAYEALREAR